VQRLGQARTSATDRRTRVLGSESLGIRNDMFVHALDGGGSRSLEALFITVFVPGVLLCQRLGAGTIGLLAVTRHTVPVT